MEQPGPALELEWLEGDYAIWRLQSDAPDPIHEQGEDGSELLSVTRTAEEVSVVGRESRAPAGAPRSGGWVALRVAGRLDHSLTGILASLAVPLAAAGVPLFAVSTFDTDYLLVPSGRRQEAAAALRDAGHRVG